MSNTSTKVKKCTDIYFKSIKNKHAEMKRASMTINSYNRLAFEFVSAFILTFVTNKISVELKRSILVPLATFDVYKVDVDYIS